MKKYISGSIISTFLIIFGFLAWPTINEGSTNQTVELDEPSNEAALDNMKPSIDSEDKSSPEISSNEDSTSNEATVAVQEVEFQPIDEDDDPEDIPLLPVTTNHYTISQLSNDFFEIELYAIINNPSQYNEYQNQLSIYKQEALNYLADNELSAQSSRISYIPAEAAQL